MIYESGLKVQKTKVKVISQVPQPIDIIHYELFKACVTTIESL